VERRARAARSKARRSSKREERLSRRVHRVNERVDRVRSKDNGLNPKALASWGSIARERVPASWARFVNAKTGSHRTRRAVTVAIRAKDTFARMTSQYKAGYDAAQASGHALGPSLRRLKRRIEAAREPTKALIRVAHRAIEYGERSRELSKRAARKEDKAATAAAAREQVALMKEGVRQAAALQAALQEA
jgi:hypothetical protein